MKKVLRFLAASALGLAPANLPAECVTVNCVSSSFCTVCTSSGGGIWNCENVSPAQAKKNQQKSDC